MFATHSETNEILLLESIRHISRNRRVLLLYKNINQLFVLHKYDFIMFSTEQLNWFECIKVGC